MKPTVDATSQVAELKLFMLGSVDIIRGHSRHEYTPEQLEWLRAIAGFIAANAEIGPRDLMEMPSFTDKGGLLKARELFGSRLKEIMDELEQALVV